MKAKTALVCKDKGLCEGDAAADGSIYTLIFLSASLVGSSVLLGVRERKLFEGADAFAKLNYQSHVLISILVW